MIITGNTKYYMKKYLVYTVLVGCDYDNLLNLSCFDERFDYICFVRKGDKKSEYIGNWRIIELNSFIDDNARLSRFPKLVPHRTEVSKYEYSLYIDANINITSNEIYDRFLYLVGQNTHIALLKHPFRDCVYQEAYVCIASLKGGWLDILRQLISLRLSGVKSHSGLYEANLIFRKHNAVEIVSLDDLWWDTFMNFSKRDQLSLIYSLNKKSIKPTYFLEPFFSTRNHPALEKMQHNRVASSTKIIFKKKIVSILYKIFKPLLKEESKG